MSATRGIVPVTLPTLEPQRHGQTSESTTWNGRDVSALELDLAKTEQKIDRFFANLVQDDSQINRPQDPTNTSEAQEDRQQILPSPNNKNEHFVQNLKANKWTQAEIETLEEMHSRVKKPTLKELAKALPGRSKDSIKCKRKRLNLVSGHRRWSVEETQKLKAMFAQEKEPSDKELCLAFSERSIASIKLKSIRLGLVSVSKCWSKDETEKLQELFSNEKSVDYKKLCQAIPGKSLRSITAKIKRLGLLKPNPKK